MRIPLSAPRATRVSGTTGGMAEDAAAEEEQTREDQEGEGEGEGENERDSLRGREEPADDDAGGGDEHTRCRFTQVYRERSEAEDERARASPTYSQAHGPNVCWTTACKSDSIVSAW